MDKNDNTFSFKNINPDVEGSLDQVLLKLKNTSPEAELLINENKDLFEKLKSNQYMFNTLLENIPDSVYFKDRDCKFIRTSKHLAKAYKRNGEDDLLGKTDAEFHGPEHTKKAFADEQGVMNTSKPLVNIIEKVIRAGGIEKWLTTTKLPLKDIDNNVIGMFGISRDITEFIEAKEKLALINEELTTTQEELKQNIEELNSVQEELLYQKEELENKNDLISIQNEKLETGKLNLEQKVLNRTKDLKLAKDRAEKSDNLKSTFLANMSHEIRTPMNAIIGFTDLLQNLVTESTAKRYLNSIRVSGKNLINLINDILDLSRIEAGKLEINYEIIETYSFFEEIKAIFKKPLVEANLNFDLQIQDKMPQGLLIDEARLRQVLINIIGNAIKFTPKGTIKLQVLFDKKEKANTSDELIDLKIQITDTGIGMTKEFQKKVFESFMQQDSINIKKNEGTGLGLTITKRLVELMNGNIELESEVNNGSSFMISFPDIIVSHFFKLDKEVPIVDYRAVVFEPATILIADDIEFNREYLDGIFNNTPLNALYAIDGEMALEMALEFQPDLIMTDIKMPKLDGIGLLKKLKQNELTSSIPVIAISAAVMKTEQEEILQSGFSTLIVKPFEVHQLIEVLIKFLKYNLEGNTPLPDDNFSAVKITLSDELGQKLIQLLEGDLMEIWKGFKEQQPMDEVESFAIKLEELTKKYPESNLIAYARQLKEAVNDFDIVNLLKYIMNYTELIDTIKHELKE